jgi:uncharacterized membrane protein YraQ (UPF0718 family)
VLTTYYRERMHQLWQLYNYLEENLRGTYTERVLAQFFELFFQLWYFVLIGAIISTLVWCYLPKAWLRSVLERRAASSIAIASLLGLVSPLCTFAAIPIVGRLIALRMPAAPLIAFMVASPLMNPALFFYTTGIINLEMAVARTLTALSIGLLSGAAVRFAQERGHLRFDALTLERVPTELSTAMWAPGQTPNFTTTLRRFREDLLFIGRFFTFGIAIAALVQALISEDFVRFMVGGDSAWAVPTALALGIPLYACGGGTLPVVETMMRMGMTTGAALAFFISGPATKFSTLSMLTAVFGKRLLGLYLIVMLGSALLWGYTYPFTSRYLETKIEWSAR